MTGKNLLVILALLLGILGYILLFSNTRPVPLAAQTDLPPFPTATPGGEILPFPTATSPTLIPTNTTT
ncbi:MAG: hypothetical protein K8I82_24515, partial [Anaerolineae bacterium]|nr:hypothetical protein [Anaerolineae bacterium]